MINLFLIPPVLSMLKSSSASVLSCINISADALQVDQGCVIGVFSSSELLLQYLQQLEGAL